MDSLQTSYEYRVSLSSGSGNVRTTVPESNTEAPVNLEWLRTDHISSAITVYLGA